LDSPDFLKGIDVATLPAVSNELIVEENALAAQQRKKLVENVLKPLGVNAAAMSDAELDGLVKSFESSGLGFDSLKLVTQGLYVLSSLVSFFLADAFF